MFTFLYVEDMPDKRWLGILLQSVSLAEAAEKKRAKYFRGMIRRLGTERRSNKKSGNILAKLDNSFSRTFQTGDYLRIIIHSGMDFFLFFLPDHYQFNCKIPYPRSWNRYAGAGYTLSEINAESFAFVARAIIQ